MSIIAVSVTSVHEGPADQWIYGAAAPHQQQDTVPRRSSRASDHLATYIVGQGFDSGDPPADPFLALMKEYQTYGKSVLAKNPELFVQFNEYEVESAHFGKGIPSG
ncbi:hypothetical protein K504DRAFT_498848 [Pleomassaria siparia CBS 279.74]|uniref:Uncharacterized protein n=1 Tax=Pleomassaria siparia CBS 279.74 TaxID=1314801 RepID=A0A6G1KME8_9PLEO|nr:hypothetical protein K504DRAFT_498848 [Pleomassaria siparia CBS 279.74]